MRRLARRLFTLCSAASLLLCVAVCVLWVRTLFVTDYALWVTPAWYVHAKSGDGALAVDWHRNGVVWQTLPGRSHVAYRAATGHGAAARFGYFQLERGRVLRTDGAWVASHLVVVPYWAIALPSAAAPLGWAWRRRAARARSRSHHGLCPACGYDLRASPDRCPECGAAKAKA